MSSSPLHKEVQEVFELSICHVLSFTWQQILARVGVGYVWGSTIFLRALYAAQIRYRGYAGIRNGKHTFGRSPADFGLRINATYEVGLIPSSLLTIS